MIDIRKRARRARRPTAGSIRIYISRSRLFDPEHVQFRTRARDER